MSQCLETLHERERLIIKATSTPQEFQGKRNFTSTMTIWPSRKRSLRKRSSWRHDTHMVSLTEFFL